MSDIEGTNIQAQGRTSRSRRRRISLAIAGVAVILVAGTVVIGTQANGSRSGSLLSGENCNGVTYTIEGKGPWSKFNGLTDLATPAQIEALNRCQKFSKWVLDNGQLTGGGSEIKGFFWAPDKIWCQATYYSFGSNYKETYCVSGEGSGDYSSYAIVIG